MTLRRYHVSARAKAPLREFVIGALRGAGCQLLYASPEDEAPFRFTFETPEGERMGIIVYAFLANQKLTKNRPDDEHRFQVKYASKDGKQHELWQDPFGLYTTLFLGINPEQGFFVGADPVLHSPTRMFISLEFKQHQVDEILRSGWHAWERESRRTLAFEGEDDQGPSDSSPVEVLVGGRREMFLRYIRFEREARGEDQGHRQLLAETFSTENSRLQVGGATLVEPSPKRLHALAAEFQMTEEDVFDLIGKTPRLKMAVRGWVAEEHLLRALKVVPGVESCSRSTEEGGPDVRLRFCGVDLTVECKNVLRKKTASNLARIDFQRTRASKTNPCSRYYSPMDFQVVAACLHAVTLQWEFRYVDPFHLDSHGKCDGKLSNNVRVDDRWQARPEVVLAAAARRIAPRDVV